MPTDPERREIFDALERTMGERPAALMMESMTLADSLRGDMSQLRGDMSQLRGEMSQLRGEMGQLRGEMSELRAELKGDIAELRAEVKAEIAAQVPRVVLANVGLAFATAGLVLTAAKLA